MCGKGDKKEDSHEPQWRHVLGDIAPSLQEAPFCSLFLLGGLFGDEVCSRLPLLGNNVLAVMHTHCSFMFSWAEGIISPSVRDSSALWGFFSAPWIILNLAFVPYFFHLIIFLIVQGFHKSWKELPGWCPKYRNNNLFEMEKQNYRLLSKVLLLGLAIYNGSSGGTELYFHLDYKHKHNKSPRQYILFISIVLEFETILIV